jgi:hypothetical protein
MKKNRTIMIYVHGESDPQFVRSTWCQSAIPCTSGRSAPTMPQPPAMEHKFPPLAIHLHFQCDDMVRYGPPNNTYPPPARHQRAYYRYVPPRPYTRPCVVRLCAEDLALPTGAGSGPVLSTSSDFAASRGKRGCASHQLCSCKMGTQTHKHTYALEDAAHVCFECEYHTAIRRPLQAAATAWCHEAGTSPSKSGLAGAICWAAVDGLHAAGRCLLPVRAALRDCAVAFYAKAMAIRYNKFFANSDSSSTLCPPPTTRVPQTWTCCAVQIATRVPLSLYLGPRLVNVVSLRTRPNSLYLQNKLSPYPDALRCGSPR